MPRLLKAPPKPGNLSDLKSALQRFYTSYHNDVRAMRKVYRKDFRIARLPEGVAVHKSSTGRNLVDNLSDQMRVDNPKVTFHARGTSQAATRHKDLMETWGRHIMQGIPKHSVIDFQEQVKHDLLLDKAACVKFTIDIEELPEPPSRGSFGSDKAYKAALAEWQIEQANAWASNVKPLDVLTIMPDPAWRKEPSFYLEVQERFAYDIAAVYEAFKPDRAFAAKGPLATSEWLEYWSAEHYIVEADGQRIVDKPNPYGGTLPYRWEWNGLGRNDESGDPTFRGESILAPILGELEEEVRVKTAMSAQWQFHVFPRLITTMPAVQARKAFMKGPGGIITVSSMQEKPEWLQVTPPNQQMVQFLAEVKGNINQRFPPSLNQRTEGVDAAVHQALLQGSATKPLQPIKNALNRLSTGLLNGIARQIKALQLDMNVFGDKAKADKARLVKADDFTHFNFEIQYEATDPAEDDRKLLTGIALMRIPGLLPRRTFREKFAGQLNLNNDEEETQSLLEQISDALAPLLVEAAAQEMGVQEQAAQEEGVLGATREAAEAVVPGSRERGLEAAGGSPTREATQTEQEGFGASANRSEQ